ncbi:MAG: endonuclease/exonuclease/phosphatase family protein [Armatimonadetes bacterium]|nr:endonuclease/exonuclease/phosphatase family protein [Armatimonadota bacterium]
MKLAAWNIRAGGGRRSAEIARVLIEEAPDVIVLTEYRAAPGRELRTLLAPLGHHKDACGAVAEGVRTTGLNCVCVLSAGELRPVAVPATPTSSHRWVAVEHCDADMTLLAVHVPNQTEVWNKREFWDCVLSFAEARADDRALIVGDLNTALDEDCQGDPIREAVFLKHLIATGWTDAWRACNPETSEYSWFSHRQNGFRLDHCYVSPALAHDVTTCRFRHDVRTERISDHSLLTVEFR